MLEALAQARLWLANLDPAAPAVTLMLGVFLTIYSIRRWFPRAWLWVEKTVPFVDSIDYQPAATILWKAWQAWPAALLGAVTSALSTGVSVAGALKGAGLGLVVAAIHELANAYRGAVGTPKPKNPSSSSLSMLALALCISTGAATGCALFGPKGSAWPPLGACAPTEETLFSEVESVLTSSGGSYEDDLLALAKSLGKEGFAVVECAVKAVVEQLSARIATRRPGERITPDEGLGVARGKAFLAKIEEAHK